MPNSLVAQPKARAKGRNPIQEIVLTPDATPARMVEGTASWSSALTWIPAAARRRARTIWAPMTMANEVLMLGSALAVIIRAANTAAVAGWSRRIRSATSPPTPRVETRPAQ